MTDDDDRRNETGYDSWQRPESATLSKRGCVRSCGCLGLMLLAAILLVGLSVYQFCLRATPLTIRAETTVLTEPRKSDGLRIDYFKAIDRIDFPTDGAGDENGFRVMFESFRGAVLDIDSRQGRPWHVTELCRRYGLDPWEEAPLKLVLPKNESLVDPLQQRPWTLKEHPELESWVEDIGPALDGARSALACPRYEPPCVRRDESELCLEGIVDLRSFHRDLESCLRLRALLRLGEGHPSAAWEDVLSYLRLRRHVLVCYDFENEEEEFAKHLLPIMTVFLDIARTGNITQEQWKRWIADLESIPEDTRRVERIEVFRYLVLDLLGQPECIPLILRNYYDTELTDEARWITIVGFNWNVVAWQFNKRIDAYRDRLLACGEDYDKLNDFSGDGESQRLYHDIQSYFDRKGSALWPELLLVDKRSLLLGDYAAFFITYSPDIFFRFEWDERKRIDLFRAAMELERRYDENGEYPESLEFPVPIRYRRHQDGYLLSLGEMSYEGGRSPGN